MEKFCSDLKELGTKIINYEEKEMIPLTNNENRSYEKQKECYICKKEFCYNKNEENKFKLYQKVRDYSHYTGKFRGAAHTICDLRYKVLREIPVVFHNGSTYDYHFIIKQLAEEFEGQFNCLGENTEKHITFSVPIYKENDNGNKTLAYKLNFIDSYSLCQPHCQILLITCQKLIIKITNVYQRIPSVYQFCKDDLNKFVLLLRKDVYPPEYMDSWEKFDEASLPPKEALYSKLSFKDIIDKDYSHAQKVWNVFEIRNLGNYHDLYVQTDTLFLADVFEKFRDKCIEIYGLDPSHILSAPGLACLKKHA